MSINFSEVSTYYIIGITVEFIPYEEKWKNSSNGLENTNWFNSGYSVVVPADAIYGLINFHK